MRTLWGKVTSDTAHTAATRGGTRHMRAVIGTKVGGAVEVQVEIDSRGRPFYTVSLVDWLGIRPVGGARVIASGDL